MKSGTAGKKGKVPRIPNILMEVFAMKTSYFRPVDGLEDAVILRSSYRNKLREVIDALLPAAAYDYGFVALELCAPDALPDRLRGKQIPAITAITVEPLPDHLFRERAVTVYVTAEDLRRAGADRGEPVAGCVLSVRDFLAYVGSRELSARFVAGGMTFDVLWCALNDTRDRAAALAEEDAALDGERSA